jgi:hypothetical protein
MQHAPRDGVAAPLMGPAAARAEELEPGMVGMQGTGLPAGCMA